MSWLYKTLISSTTLALSLASGCATTNLKPNLTPNLNSLEEKVEGRKYAVLLVDSMFGSDDSFDLKRGRKRNPYNLAEELPNMATVLEQANSLGLSVFEIIPEDYVNGPERYVHSTTKELTFYRGNNWSFMKKPEASAFLGTNLDEQLQAQEVTDLIVIGFSQNCCVEETVRSALDLGYEVHTSFDTMQAFVNTRECDWYEQGELYGRMDRCFGSDIPETVEVRFFEEDIDESIEFYSQYTHLVDSYLEFPIFEVI